MRNVAALPSIALLAGCASGLLADHPPVLASTFSLSVSIGLALMGAYAGRAHLVGCAVALGFFAGGALLSASAWQHARRTPLRIDFERLARAARADAQRHGVRLSLDDEATATIVGVLDADASTSANGVSIRVRVTGLEAEEVQDGREGRDGQDGSACGHAGRGPEKPERGVSDCGGVLLTVVGSIAADRADDWRAGRRVRLPAQLRRPARYLDPGVPDGERALARRGVTLVGTVKSGALVEVLARGSWWMEALASARAFARRAIHDAVAIWSPQSAAIVAAIVIGDRSTLDDRVELRLQEAGTYHVIAISGGNIAILAGLMLGGFRLAGWLGRGAMVAAIALLVVYAGFVGGGASVNRATLMAVLYFGARSFDHRGAPLNTLPVAAALLALADPLSILDPAFLLTFGATLAILVLVPALDASRWPSSTRVLVVMLAASAAAEVVLFPVGAVLFSRVTFAGLALNFLAIPLMSVAQIAGTAVLPLALVSARLASGAGWIAHVGAAGLIASADLVRFAPAVTWRLAPPPAAVCTIYYASLIVVWVGWQRRRSTTGSAESSLVRRIRHASAATAIAAAVWILVDPRTVLAASGDGRLRTTFIDVGQGDAAFIVFPRGSTLLVDTGGLGFSSPFDIGDRVVAPVIRSLGFRRIDRLAFTHGDPDHIGGGASILREFRPFDVWEGIPVPRSGPLTALRLQAQRNGARWSNVHAGDHLTIDEVGVTALHPDPEEWERQKVRNDDSLVLEIRWRDVSIVLTGDIGRVPEQRLASAFAPARIRILKVPHHGSLTSSSAAFVNALKPTIAVVSAGRGNHYGHPAPEVLQRYESAGAHVLRTDLDGAVTLSTDGYSADVTTFAARF